MHQAGIVERGPARQVLAAPTHPWTRRLLEADPGRWDPAWRNPAPKTGAAAPLIEARGLAKAFGGRTLFSDLDVSISPGERLALTGPSGCGKTTLGGILLKLVAPDAGEVHHHAGLAGGRLQKLYQDPAVAFPARVPIRAGIRDVVRLHRVSPERVPLLMDRLRLDHSLLDRRPGEVSGGELQRLAIIRAMLLNPLVVFADEPTSRLDLLTQQETVNCLMEQVAEQDAALVLVTHDVGLAAAVAGRHLSLEEAPVAA